MATSMKISVEKLTKQIQKARLELLRHKKNIREKQEARYELDKIDMQTFREGILTLVRNELAAMEKTAAWKNRFKKDFFLKKKIGSSTIRIQMCAPYVGASTLYKRNNLTIEVEGVPDIDEIGFVKSLVVEPFGELRSWQELKNRLETCDKMLATLELVDGASFTLSQNYRHDFYPFIRFN